tara:strand:+ start:38016 stop:38900 length:885 start_codon:yes stop_codon:yes gene_type:complete
MERLWKKSLLALTLGSALLTGCGGSGGGGGSSTGGGGSTSTYGLYNSPYITATGFVNALNDVDGVIADSEVILYTDETYRSMEPGQDDWFVIYDAKYDENKAVSLQYVRSMYYYDYYSNNYATGDEFRAQEDSDIFSGDINGDFWGDNYEVVDYDDFTGSFWGRNSGFEYEDEEDTNDASLMVADKEQLEFFKKASKVSFAFSVSMETAMSLVTLGNKVEGMVAKSQEQLTPDDQMALMGDLETLTGVSLGEMMEATVDNAKKETVVSKIAEKIGTTAQNLESKLLPEVFGLEI